jgi:hypothetical protein
MEWEKLLPGSFELVKKGCNEKQLLPVGLEPTTDGS